MIASRNVRNEISEMIELWLTTGVMWIHMTLIADQLY